MNIRINKGDWYTNSGIVGLIELYNYYGQRDDIKIEYDYIEFDSSLLEDFHIKYLKYFNDKHNMYRRISNIIDTNLDKIKNNPNKLKIYSDYIENGIKSHIDKIKQYFEDDYIEAKEAFESFKKVKKVDELDEIISNLTTIKEIFSREHVNEKLSLNITRSYLFSNFFGQGSFLQRNCNEKNLVGQSEIIYKDYIKNTLDYYNIKHMVNENNIEDIERYIKEQLDQKIEEEKKTKDKKNKKVKGYKFIEGVSKVLKKDKTIQAVESYLQSETSSKCDICGEFKSDLKLVNESDFVPLFVSTQNALNYYWNGVPNVHMCPICRLLFLCVPIGSTTNVFSFKESVTKAESKKSFYTFINIMGSIEEIYRVNKPKDVEEDISENLILNLLKEKKNMSEKILNNIEYIEFKAVYEAKYGYISTNILSNHTAKFLSSKHNGLDAIYSNDLKLKSINYIVSNKDLDFLILDSLKNSDKYYGDIGEDCFRLAQIRDILNKYRTGVITTMNDDDKKRLRNTQVAIKEEGHEIRNLLIKTSGEKKVESVYYRLCKSVKLNNKNDFIQGFLWMLSFVERTDSSATLNTLANDSIDFKSVGFMFLSGLKTKKYIKSEDTSKENNKEEN